MPKRSDQRRRRNADSKVDVIEATEQVKIPDPSGDLHPDAMAWYQSLIDSPQSRYYEASDWHTAIIAARLLDDYLTNNRIGAITEWRHLSVNLLVTEADRRRGRIEVKRGPHAQDPSQPDLGQQAVIDMKRQLGVA